MGETGILMQLSSGDGGGSTDGARYGHRGLLFLVGRLVYGAILGFMGLNHFLDLETMSCYAKSKRVPAPRAGVIISGLLLILGGLAVGLGVYPLVGAAFLALFFLVVTPMMHNFWTG